MVAQLTGAASILVLILAYLLIVQTLMAASVLLGQFIVVQMRNLRGMVANKEPASPLLVERPSYSLGGGIKKWE